MDERQYVNPILAEATPAPAAILYHVFHAYVGYLLRERNLTFRLPTILKGLSIWSAVLT